MVQIKTYSMFFKKRLTFNGLSKSLISNDSKHQNSDFDVTDLLPCFTILTSNDDRTIDVCGKIESYFYCPSVPQVSISPLIRILATLFFK